jgi:hypothetical protein
LAHAFSERYDLPVPLEYFAVGAATAVALSFVVAAVFARGTSRESRVEGVVVPLGPLLPALRATSRALSVILLCVVVLSGLFGSRNPEMNFATVLVWIVWWVGLSFLVACIGNLWPALDPWRALFEGMDALARRLGFSNGISLGRPYPRRLGAWPAAVLLLVFVWIEVIYPRAAAPLDLAWMALAWSAITLTGMVCFGRDTWQRNADVFAVYFETLGRFAPIDIGPDRRSVVLRLPGRGLITAGAVTLGMVGFVLAMLATVLFDGLLSTRALAFIDFALSATLPGFLDDGGYVLGTTGLISVWLLFLGAYLLSCLVTAHLVRDRPVAVVARTFVLTLVPIAIAYNVAHYFSYLVVQGQLIIPLLSDPFGLKWNLFGTARYRPDIGLIDARFAWYLAISAIVAGHVISIWLAHRLALREYRTPRQAMTASIPLTVLMMTYTATSLLVIAEPLVQFTQPAGSPQSGEGVARSPRQTHPREDAHTRKRAQPEYAAPVVMRDGMAISVHSLAHDHQVIEHEVQ